MTSINHVPPSGTIYVGTPLFLVVWMLIQITPQSSGTHKGASVLQRC